MDAIVRRTLELHGVTFVRCIGVGAFAEVYEVLFRGVPRALRVCIDPFDDARRGQVVRQERETLRQIVRIPALANCIGYIEEIFLDKHYVTVWQLAETNLLSWWRSSEASDRRLLHYLRYVAYSIDLFNDRGFNLRDVKPENILIDGDAAWLCDVGLAKQVGDSTYLGTVVGTPNHMPWEMERYGESHPTNDLYCLAASYLRLKTRSTPRQFWERRSAPGLGRVEAAVIAEALDPDPDRRPRGAVHWVERLAKALETWKADEISAPTVVMQKRGILLFLRRVLYRFAAACLWLVRTT